MPKKLLLRVLHSPFGFQLVSLSFFVFFIVAFRPPYALMGEGGQYFGEDSLTTEQPLLLITGEGFIQNTIDHNTTNAGSKRDREVTYIIKPKDNISKIAYRFKVKVSTLLWANKLTAKGTLHVGQKMRIPPTDGVFYQVAEGDTLGEVAKLHKIDLAKIYAYNSLRGNTIHTGQEIFLPDASQQFISRPSTLPVAKTSGGKGKLASLSFTIHKPTVGTLTQGFKSEHYALDIANKWNTPIYASGPGKVIKSQDGWNYGYGKMIIIDHGNGIETLYGHMNTRKVKVGDQVKSGQLIGLMGNSGRVFGVTGIHLHFELRIRGRKVNPFNYF